MFEPLFLLLLIGLSLPFWALGVVFGLLLRRRRRLQHRLAARGVNAQAEVIAHRDSKISTRAAREYYLTYRYRVTAADGTTQEFEHETAVSKSDYDTFDIGTPVPIRYAPEAPDAALLGAGMHETYSNPILWLNTLGGLGLGLAFLVGAASYALSASKNYALPGAVSDGPLVVSVLVSSKLQILRLRTDGSHRSTLAHGSVDLQDPVWSPDGSRIAFVSGSAIGSAQNIELMEANGQNQKVLTTQPGGSYAHLAWSPDGKQLLADAYFSNHREIWLVPADGTPARKLSGGAAEDDAQPAWSPDGRQIAFQRSILNAASGAVSGAVSGATSGLWIMPADGSPATALTDGAQDDADPAWSPDGRRIAFIRRQQNPGVWVMNCDGSNAVELEAGQNFQLDLAWSPNGKSLAVIGAPAGGDEVLEMNADGSNAQPAVASLEYSDLGFTWSPDSQALAVVANGPSEKLGELLILNPQQQTRVEIMTDLYTSGAPAWRPAQ